MNKIDYLLTCLMEECSEISKEVAKALRFGLDDKYKNFPIPHDAIIREYYDVVTLMESLYDCGALKRPSVEEAGEMIAGKRKRIKKFMDYSAKRGRYAEDK